MANRLSSTMRVNSVAAPTKKSHRSQTGRGPPSAKVAANAFHPMPARWSAGATYQIRPAPAFPQAYSKVYTTPTRVTVSVFSRPSGTLVW